MEQMSLKVTCPQCKQLFDFYFSEKGKRICPNCKLGIPDEKILPHPSSMDKLQKPEESAKWTRFIELELSKYLDKRTIPDDCYTLKWNTDHPGHIVFLLDLSGSMAENNKIDYLIDSVQTTIENLLTHCRNDQGKPAERVEVSIYGYNYRIIPLWPNYNVEKMTRAMLEADDNGVKVFNRDIQVKPEYQTRMQIAFEKAKEDVEDWIHRQERKKIANIPSPIVINVTDGYPYEGKEHSQEKVFSDTLQAARALMSVGTKDGNVRIFNIHYEPISMKSMMCFPNVIPKEETIKFLYEASSVLTKKMAESARLFGFEEAQQGSHALISNSKDPSVLTSFLDWGSSQGVKPIHDDY